MTPSTSLGSCDDCDQVWVIETDRGKRCRAHHAADKARPLHPAAWTDDALDRLLTDVLTFDLDAELIALLETEG
jgi:hypothetical protein